ncbi:unnamed protein product [Phytophthora fragariaefolia]|uniref:Unnamed protein product n=1 Tax=Phytophthora fragariaefolia TaxID=1490495 RepID=A0A9W6XP16_9STRA|nr:unnamed protein product [Phytophthora fragariaefolia]
MEDSGSRLPERQDFPHLSDAHWATLDKMVSLLGEAAFAGFPNLSVEEQRARVERFDKYESSLIAHVSAAAQEAARGVMRAEAQSAAQASATNATSFAARPTTTKPVKMSIPTFDGKDSDSLVFWVREIEIALSAGQIYDARAQVAFALSNLGGRARAWAMAREMATPGYFTSWSFMEQELRSTFLLANVAYRRRSNLLRCKQGKRSLQAYVMELHNLEAAMAGAPLSEDVKVTVFMDGVLGKRQLPVGAGRPAGRLRSSSRKVSASSTSSKEQVPGATLLCLSVTAARSNLVAVTASVKGYPESMTVPIDSGASFNFATKASVARNNALYASALEASKSNTNLSVRLATGSIVSRRKVTIPFSVKFDDFNSVEPFIVLDMDERYDLIPGMSWLAKHEPWIDWPRELEVGDDKDPQDPRNLSSWKARFCSVQPSCIYPRDSNDPRRGRSNSSRRKGGAASEPPLCKGWWLVQPTMRKALELCLAQTRVVEFELPLRKAIRGDKVTGAPKAEAPSRDADSAAEDRAPQVVDAFTGEPKVGEVLSPLPTVEELLELDELSYVEFLHSLKAGELAEVVLLRSEDDSLKLNSSSVMDSEVFEDERTSRRQTRYGAAILKDPSDPYYPLLKEFSDVVSDDPPSVLPPDRGVRHEIDLVPGTKYCTTRQWPLPKEQVDVIDAFFAAKHAAGMVRESKSPHSFPTFCGRKTNGKWRMVHAFNKLNVATIPASTPIPRKDVLQNNMAGCTVFSALDMVDGYYQLLMRESDIPLTVVKIPFLGCFLGKDGVRADPEKVCAIAQWPVPVSQKDLRKWLGLANYLHKYSANYADMARPLTHRLKKDAVWSWTSEAQQAFEAIKSSLQSAPILALPDEDRPFSVACDASDFAIGCAL